MEKARIRHGEIRDAERIAQLMTELGYPTTVEAMRDRLGAIVADPDYTTFVADTGASVVGVAGARLGKYYENDGEVLPIAGPGCVFDGARTRTGTRLVEAVERWADSKGARAIVVNSALHRADAHGFYERRQYARTGYRFVKQMNHSGLAHGRPE